MIPCVLYGLGKDSVPLSIPEGTVNAMIRAGKRMVDLHVGRKKEAAIIKSIQFHPVTDRVIHIDFTRVAVDQVVINDAGMGRTPERPDHVGADIARPAGD